MVAKLFYALSILRRRGLSFFFIYFRESVWFDLRHRTRTSARVPKQDQDLVEAGTDAADGLLYVASFTTVTRQSVALAEQILGSARFRQAQFLDLGCGKGKALLVYALNYARMVQHPPVGIEYDSDLADLAKANVRACGFQPNEVQVAADSATNIREYTAGDLSIIYLYNSFQGETLSHVLNALRDHPHLLIYVDPAEAQRLAHFGYEILERRKGRYNADTWLVARSETLRTEPGDAG